MTPSSENGRGAALVLFALVCTALSGFFVFYTARRLYVTHGLRSIRAGGGGAYAGAIVFPVLAFLFGWAARRFAQKLRRAEKGVGA